MIKTLGLILKKQAIGETDRIITIFSPDFGKKRVIARAVRRPLSKLAGHLDTFMLSSLILTDEEDLPKITSAVLAEPFEKLRSSLELMGQAFAVSRVVERVILEDVNQRSLFNLTLDALARINSNQNWSANWLFFLSQLANQLGLGISDFSCRACQKPIITNAFFDPADRRFICVNCSRGLEPIQINKNSVKLLQLLRRKSFVMIRTISIPNIVAQEVEELLLREITEWFNHPWDSYASLAGS